MTIRIRLNVNRKSVRNAAILAGLTLPLLAGASLLRPSAPKSFDFNEFERERAAAQAAAQLRHRPEPTDRDATVQTRQDLNKSINSTLVVYGSVEGTRK